MMRALCYWMRQFVKKQLNEVSHGKILATVITLALNKRTKSILFNRLFFQSQGKTKVIQILFQKSKSLQEKLWVFNFFNQMHWTVSARSPWQFSKKLNLEEPDLRQACPLTYVKREVLLGILTPTLKSHKHIINRKTQPKLTKFPCASSL